MVSARTDRDTEGVESGAGSPGHLTTELFKTASGAQMQHVPYKGPAAAIQDVMSGQVECGFLAGPTVLPHVRAGKLVALAVSGVRRSPLLPEVPTVAESGYPGFDATFSLVLFAPRGTPAPTIQAMYTTMAQALKQPEHSRHAQPQADHPEHPCHPGIPAHAAHYMAALKWRA